MSRPKVITSKPEPLTEDQAVDVLRQATVDRERARHELAEADRVQENAFANFKRKDSALRKARIALNRAVQRRAIG